MEFHPPMKMTLERRIIFFAFIILFLTILANSGMDIIGFRRDYVNALVLRSQSLGATMKGNVEKVLGLGLELKDISDISEKCRDLVHGNPEIAYCIITNLDGIPLFANDPDFNFLQTNKISKSFRLVRMAARSPGRSIAGPDVIFMLTPISFAMMLASVVFPSPGGP